MKRVKVQVKPCEENTHTQSIHLVILLRGPANPCPISETLGMRRAYPSDRHTNSHCRDSFYSQSIHVLELGGDLHAHVYKMYAMH